MKKLTLALIAMSALVFGFGLVAEAQTGPYGGGTGRITFSPPNPGPGQTITVTITGCTPGESLTIALAGVTIATVTCVPATTTLDGAVTGLIMPSQARAGEATIIVTTPPIPGAYTCSVAGSEGYSRSATLVIVAPVTSPAGTAATGSDGIGDATPIAIAIAIGLLVVGLGLFGVTQVRRRTTPLVA